MEKTMAFPLYMDGNVSLGMTLHDYFAAAALPGLLQTVRIPYSREDIVAVAAGAFQIADEMIKAKALRVE